MSWPGAKELTPAQRRVLGKASTAASIIVNLRSASQIGLHPEDMDADPYLLATPEGVVDLKTGKMLEAARDSHCTKKTLVAPASGPCPIWQSVISRAARGDSSMLGYLQRWFGYILTGDTREEALLFIHGPGGSGKSKPILAIAEILGDYAKASNMEAFTAKQHSDHSTEIAKLAGARMVTATETDAGSRWNEPRIKALTGRDKVAARFMRRDEFEFMPTFKIVIVGNHRPGLKTVGEDMRRRLHLVEFPDVIPEEERDRGLPEKLQAEYPQILHWMIEGCLAWQEMGLGKPERVAVDTDAYFQAIDVLGGWIDDCVERVQGVSAKVSDCYKSYCQHVKERGEYEPSMTRFSEDMQARGFETFKSSVMHFKHCKLKTGALSAPAYAGKFED